MSRLIVLATITSAVLLAGCNGTIVPKPGTVSLEEALESVGLGLAKMKKAQEELRTGLSPREVTVTFNVSSSSEGRLVVEVGAPPAAPVTGEAGGQLSFQASRGNQVTIKFTNLLFADEDTLIRKMESQKIDDLLRVLEKHEFDMFRLSRQDDEGVVQEP